MISTAKIYKKSLTAKEFGRFLWFICDKATTGVWKRLHDDVLHRPNELFPLPRFFNMESSTQEERLDYVLNEWNSIMSYGTTVTTAVVTLVPPRLSHSFHELGTGVTETVEQVCQPQWNDCDKRVSIHWNNCVFIHLNNYVFSYRYKYLWH